MGYDVTYHLAVVEMMLHTFDFLIVLVSLAGYEDYAAGGGEGCGCADSLAAVCDVESGTSHSEISNITHF